MYSLWGERHQSVIWKDRGEKKKAKDDETLKWKEDRKRKGRGRMSANKGKGGGRDEFSW